MPLFKRLDTYMVRELVVPFLIGQGAVVMMLTGTVLYNNAQIFLSYQIPAIGVAKVAFYFLPFLINMTMPVATAIACSLLVSRLARDSEITVMRGSGLSLKRIFRPLFAVGIVLSLVDFAFGEKVVPWANQQYENTLAALSKNIKFLVPQERQIVQSEDRQYAVYIDRMNITEKGATISGVMFWIKAQNNPMPTTILAPTADYADGVWTLHNANIYLYEDYGRRVKTFQVKKRVLINFRLGPKIFNQIYLQMPLYSSGAAVRSVTQMHTDIAEQRKRGYVNQTDLLEYHFKLSVPFSCLVFAIVCPPLALRFARAGNFMGVLLSIILVFIYWNLLLAAKIIGTNNPNLLPPMAAAWGQNILFCAVGVYFLWRGE